LSHGISPAWDCYGRYSSHRASGSFRFFIATNLSGIPVSRLISQAHHDHVCRFYANRFMGNQFLVFTLDDQSYALHLPSVDRVARMAEITSLPNAPGIVLGVINIHGGVVPVIDFRQRFNLPKRETVLDDRLIFAHAGLRRLALIADSVTEVIECPQRSLTLAEHILPGVKYLEGILKFKDGLVLIHDLDKFLSLDEEKALDIALDTA
jgi:purine-binding chemotaxis protein CheW